MKRAALGLIVAAAVTAGPAAARRAWAQTTVTVTVDGTAAGSPLERVWPFHGFDEVNYSTTPDGKALLAALAGLHTAPVHIRSHFLLNTGNGTPSLKWGSTNVYTEDAAGNPVYSWTLMDGIMDAVTGAGAFPLAEIAFMPQAMTSAAANVPYQNTGVYNLDGACFYPPKDFTKWGALIRAWATHVAARYPNAEQNWQWELWNEPDIGYWHTAAGAQGTEADYAKLYDYTEAALHAVLPSARLGGPAVAGAGSAFLAQFLQHCASGTNAVSGAAGTRLDLITFHAKGGVTMVSGHVEMDLGNQLRLHRTGFQAVANVAAFKQTPIVITEADPDGCAACPVSMTPADAYRNSPAYGAYEIAMMKRTLELEARLGVNVEGLLTWAFTFPGTPYFAGYRALTTNGIDLPVLNDFKLLGSLQGDRLPVTSSGARTLDDILANGVRGTADVDAMATRTGQKIQVLVWNYHDDLVAATAIPVHVSVSLPAGFGPTATVTHLRVDDQHGDAYTVWTSQGSPAAPSAAQIAALQAAMQPVAIDPQGSVAVTNGAVALDFSLPRFGVSLLTIAPPGAADAGADAAAGVDASAGRGGGAGAGGGGGGGAPATGAAGASGGSGAAGAGGTPPGQKGGRGCGCAVAGAPAASGWAVAVVVLAAARRRRRRSG